MNNSLTFHELVTLDGDKLTTNTIKVAAVHGKRHDDVLRLVRKRVAEAGDWGLRNFTDTPYTDPQNGQTYPMFTMTKNGYAFLVGKMSGKLAVQHQIEVLEAFDAMADMLANQHKNLWQKMHAVHAQDTESKVKASFGSHLRLNCNMEISF